MSAVTFSTGTGGTLAGEYCSRILAVEDILGVDPLSHVERGCPYLRGYL